MTSNEIASWFAFVLLTLDLYWIGNKDLRGPIAGLFSNCCWTYVSISTWQPALLATNIMIFVLNVRTIWKWSR